MEQPGSDWRSVNGPSAGASVAAGYGQALALQGDGTVWAWGRNDSRRLGEGSIPQGLLA
jgi:alpha-tubulin suppressor-like RCC1 family protein